MSFDSKAFRDRWGLSQTVFARLLGLADGRTVRRWEARVNPMQPQGWVMRRIRVLEADLEQKLLLKMQKAPTLPTVQKNRLPAKSPVRKIGIVPSSFA